jgi:4-carboxymuconolactone decarboxylase
MDRRHAAPRIEPVTEPDGPQAEALAKTPTLPDGTVRNIFGTLAHHPTLLKRFNAFVGTFMRFSELTAYDREVVVLRVAARVRSRYELAQHIPIGLDAGIAEDMVVRLIALGSVDELPSRERLLCELADQVVATGAVGDELWAEVTGVFAPAAAVELVVLTCQYRAVGDFLNVVGVAPEPELEALLERWEPLVGAEE